MREPDGMCGCRIYQDPAWPDRLCPYHEGYAQGFADGVSCSLTGSAPPPVPEQGDLTEGNKP